MTLLRPAPRLVWLTRGVWVSVGLVLLCGAATVIYWKVEGAMNVSKPLQLPNLAQIAATGKSAGSVSTERNPFDPTGIAWRAPAAAKAQVARLEDVRGVITSPMLTGVFTSGGLVKPGEAFAGGTLQSVTRDSLVVRMPDGNTKLLQLAQQDDKVRERLMEFWAASKAR